MATEKVYIDVTDTITQIAAARVIGGIQRVILSVCHRLGQRAQPIFIDFKTGRCFFVDPYELDFHALIEELAPCLVDAYSTEQRRAALLAYFETRQAHEIASGTRIIFPGGPWNDMPFASSFISNLSQRCKVICLVHDLLPIYKPDLFRGGEPNFAQYFKDLAPIRNITWVAAADSVIEDMKRYGLKGRIVRISFGCEFDVLRPAKSENISLRGLPTENYVMLIGSIDGRKRHDLVVDAWIQSKFYEHCKLFIVAYASDPTDRFHAAYEAAREQTDRVFFLQNVHDDEMARALRYCRFVIYPSAFEGWGLPISEAAYFGKYCLVMGQNYSHHNNVIIFNEDSILSMANDRFESIISKGKFVGEKHSWHKFVEELILI